MDRRTMIPVDTLVGEDKVIFSVEVPWTQKDDGDFDPVAATVDVTLTKSEGQLLDSCVPM
jgi:hypothetical protein